MSEAPLMLSVSGARGIVGASMTPPRAAAFAAAWGSVLRSTIDGDRATPPLVCVGRDGRPSGAGLAAAAIGGLLGTGCRVIDLGVVTTPTVGVMISEHGADGGLVLTASHNPIQWNGLKCLDGHGIAPPKRIAESVIARFRADEAAWAPPEFAGNVERDDRGPQIHVDRVLGTVSADAVRARGFRVVLDSVNASGCVAGRRLLEALGCTVEHLNGEPTGIFAHTPEPLEANLVDLARATGASGAACGFAQDPDADRLAIVDEQGRFIGEEYTLVLAALRRLAVAGGGVLATNLSTSRMIDDLAARHEGARVVRSAVGEANVVEAMRREGAILGGEGNGGVIDPRVGWVRDSLAAMAVVLDLLAADGRPLSAIVADLPRYAMIKRKADAATLGGPAAIAAALAKVERAYASRGRVDASDGVRVDLEEGWVHLRASNTEPIVRLIAEAKDEAAADQLARAVAEVAGLAV